MRDNSYKLSHTNPGFHVKRFLLLICTLACAAAATMAATAGMPAGYGAATSLAEATPQVVDKKAACDSTASVVEAIAIARDRGIQAPKAMEIVLSGTSQNPADQQWAMREVRWVYDHARVPPDLAKQMRYGACAARLAG